MSKDSSDRLAMRKRFPSTDRLTKASTALCAAVLDSLDETLTLLNAGSAQLIPLQRQLASRFASACTVFARDMLAAEGDQDALRYLLKPPLPSTDHPVD